MLSYDLVAVLVGGLIGILGGVATTITNKAFDLRQKRKVIRNTLRAEVMAIQDKCQRFLDGESTMAEMKGSIPLWTSLAGELGYLTPKQAEASRRAITLNMELRHSGSMDTARKCLEASREAVALF